MSVVPQIDYPTYEPAQAFVRAAALTYYWDVNTLSAVKGTQPGGGGGGGAVTIVDGGDATQGLTSDVAWVSGSGTVISILKKIAGFTGLTDAQLRATPVPVSGTFFQGTQPVSGPLTDAQLRAVAVPVSGPLTDAQLRATPVPVSGTVTASGPLTDAQLRATAVPVITRADQTPSAPASASVGVSSAQAVAANASRKGLALVNVSNATISLGFGQTAVLNAGVTLYPGGSFEMDEYFFDLGAVNAIASAAASPLAIQEMA